MDHLALLHDQQLRFAAGLRTFDLDDPIPDCAPWTVTDVGLHLTGVHAWVSDMTIDAHRDDEAYHPTGPRDRDGLVAAYEQQAGELRDRFATVGPDAPCRTLSGPGTSAFWRRRQLHETAMHARDLEAAGAVPAPFDPHVAADGVDEVVTVFTPRQVRLGKIDPLPYAVRLAATDTGDVWQLGEGDPRATVSGTAEQLLLALWHRMPASELTVDDDAAYDLLALALTP